MGRLVNTKGLRYLVQAMKDVPIRLVICGGGPEEKRLKQQIAKLGLQDKVEMAGKVSEERKGPAHVHLQAFHHALHLRIVRHSGGRGHVLRQTDRGMQRGRPAGGRLRSPGALCSPRDPNDLAEKINALLRDDKRRSDCAHRSAKYASGYSWDLIADRMEKEYRSIV